MQQIVKIRVLRAHTFLNFFQCAEFFKSKLTIQIKVKLEVVKYIINSVEVYSGMA